MAVDLASEFTVQLQHLLKETFKVPEGIFLDPDTSLLQTLKNVTAEQASIPVGGKCASLAAQVSHVIFFIDSFERYALQNDTSRRDWQHIWKTVEKVSPAEWEELKASLEKAYHRMEKLFLENTLWDGDRIMGALSIVVHTAYHLGEIRQALCQVG
jgi:hypothetical protein